MPRPDRQDGPDTWHHVFNRGIARRTVFETRADLRNFQALLACAARSGRIEIHAYSILTTHYHLLVRSPRGELSEALRLIQNNYVRWFNRSRGRDGSLFRGRFASRPVKSDEYFVTLVHYIDHNPVEAGLCRTPAQYPHGSAWHYARASGPPWLERSSVEREVTRLTHCPHFTPTAYARVFGGEPSRADRELVEQRMTSPPDRHDPLDELLAAAPERVLEWMRLKADLSDGRTHWRAICDEDSIVRAVRAAAQDEGPWRLPCVRNQPRALEGWTQVQIVLLRELAGSTLAKIATRLGISTSSVAKAYHRHRTLLRTDEPYARRIGLVARAALDAKCGRRCQTP